MTKMNVLIIEDDEDIIKGMKNNFEKINFNVYVATKLNQASLMLSNQVYDLIILDYHLENGSKSDILISKFIDSPSNFEINKDTKLIICSGTLDSDAVLKFKKITKSFLVKPISFKDILLKLKELGLI